MSNTRIRKVNVTDRLVVSSLGGEEVNMIFPSVIFLWGDMHRALALLGGGLEKFFQGIG